MNFKDPYIYNWATKKMYSCTQNEYAKIIFTLAHE